MLQKERINQEDALIAKIKKILEEIFIIDFHSVESVNEDLSLIEKNFEILDVEYI